MEVKLILVDPKQVEMTDFKGIPHLLSPVVTDMKMAAGVLTWAVQKMEDRYSRMGHVGVRNIGTYNKMTSEERLARLSPDENPEDYLEAMPYIVIIVDEFADLMATAGKEIEFSIQRLAQKARASGIHVILATQRPSADVVTGLIKTNLPCRICFQVKSKLDSRIVLDSGGAEKLVWQRRHAVRRAGQFEHDSREGRIRRRRGNPQYRQGLQRPSRADLQRGSRTRGRAGCRRRRRSAGRRRRRQQAGNGTGRTVRSSRRSILGSAGARRYRATPCVCVAVAAVHGLGRYTRAAKLIDQMESRGIVGPDRRVRRGASCSFPTKRVGAAKNRREGPAVVVVTGATTQSPAIKSIRICSRSWKMWMA